MLTRYRGAAVGAVALILSSTILWAAGNWSTLPIIEGNSYCASTVSGTGNLSGATGQGQGTLGSICAQTVPAGPTAVTGNEVIPADLYRPDVSPPAAGLGGQPQTALVTMANLNALPLTVSTVPTSTLTTLTAVNQTGGYIAHSTATVSAVTVNLPPSPVDGQQFAFSADQIITTLLITSPTAGVTVTKQPTTITPSTTASYGYRWMYNAAATNWYRLQ
jgi:hypothetical protein